MADPNGHYLVSTRVALTTVSAGAAVLGVLLATGGSIVQWQPGSVERRLEERMMIYLHEHKRTTDEMAMVRDRLTELERQARSR